MGSTTGSSSSPGTRPNEATHMGAPRWVKERAREQSRREARAERRETNRELAQTMREQQEESNDAEAEQVN